MAVIRKKANGRKADPVSIRKVENVTDCFERNQSLSVRDVGTKLWISKSYVKEVRQMKGSKAWSKDCPNQDQQQHYIKKSCCRKLWDQYLIKYTVS